MMVEQFYYFLCVPYFARRLALTPYIAVYIISSTATSLHASVLPIKPSSFNFSPHLGS
jgi:hypothetical protein